MDTTHSTSLEKDAAARTVFQQQWGIYRGMMDHNYLFHREVFDLLNRILVDDAPSGFRFLDLGCGDAEIARAFQGTRIGRYHGVDLSRSALDLAEQSLSALDCPVRLDERDVMEFLSDTPEMADVVWSGLLLHHFQTRLKFSAMRAIRGIISEPGIFLLFEPTSQDGEDRAGWLRRWDAQRPIWTAYAQDDWDAFTAHVHAYDYPETASSWLELGQKAGFRRGHEIFVAPSDLMRMYRFDT